MTVIAFDGKTMAADRQGELYCTKTNRTKIRRIGEMLVGCAGEVRASEAVFQWLVAGADPERFPKIAESDKALVLVYGPKGLALYENGPYAMTLENAYFAIGSGGDAAMAAMALGCDARRAVEIACQVCTGCGGGIDVLSVDGRTGTAFERGLVGCASAHIATPQWQGACSPYFSPQAESSALQASQPPQS